MPRSRWRRKMPLQYSIYLQEMRTDIPFLIDFCWALHFSLLPFYFSPPLQTSWKIPMLPIYSGNLVFSYYPCRLDLCMSLLGFLLLSRFSGIVICRLFFFSLCLKTTYEWVHMITVFLGLIYLTQFGIFYIHPFVWKFQDVIIFFLLCSTPLCKCTFSLSILQLRGI